MNGVISGMPGNSDGTITFCSTSGEDYSVDSDNWQHSAFIYAIKQGLKDGLADKDASGSITLGELYDFVSAKVPQLVGEIKKGRSQHPLMPTGTVLTDLVLFINTK